MADEKKGITVKIDAALHAEIRQFIESNGMTMAEFVSQALYNELHPKIQPQEVKNMGPMRTMAFQMQTNGMTTDNLRDVSDENNGISDARRYVSEVKGLSAPSQHHAKGIRSWSGRGGA